VSFEDYDKSTKSTVAHEDLEQAKFLKTVLDEIAVRVGNSDSAPLFTHQKKEDISLNTLFNLTNSSGLLVGAEFDCIMYGVGGEGNEGLNILTYELDGVAQFQIVLDLISQENFTIYKRPAEFFLLQENGDNILLEDGVGALRTQGLTP